MTPLAQGGNPRPRLFRLSSDEALINRMGFNNAGAAALARNVMLARRHLPAGFVVGVNIGRGAATRPIRPRWITSRASVSSRRWPTTSAINVSSPNTPGLRDLQQPDRLRELLATLRAAGEQEAANRPLLVKLAPDLEADVFAALVAIVAEEADGLILSNTTTARDLLASGHRNETGGLSGRPLRAPDAGGRCARPRADGPPEGDHRLRRHRLSRGRGRGLRSRRRPGPAVDGPRLPAGRGSLARPWR